MNHIYQLLLPVISPALTSEFGAFGAGIFVLSFVISYSLLPAVSGYISSYVGRRNLLAGGFVTSALAFFVATLTNNALLIGLFFFVAGIGGSTYHPLGSSSLSEAHPLSRGRTLGLHQTGGAIGSFVGPIAAGLILAGFGWRFTLELFAIPGLVIGFALWFLIESKRHVKEDRSREQNTVFADWKTYTPAFLFMAAAFVYVFGQRGMDNFANQYFTVGRGIEILEASFLFSMLKVAGLFSAPICGKLSDRFGRKIVLISLVVVESVSLFAITVSPTILLAVPCIVFGLASFGLLGVGEALLADLTPEKHRPVMFGINLTLSFLPQVFLVPFLYSLAGSMSYDSGLVLLSAMMPISIPLLLMVKNKPSKH